ncbi:MAG: helix-turn-helix transcriptional regulator [Planctomycetota bacterium]
MVASSTPGHPLGVRSTAEANAYLPAFGLAVRQRREQLGYSQEQFAFEAELDRTYVSGIERGIRNPTLKTMIRLCKVLKTQPSTLLKDAEKLAK